MKLLRLATRNLFRNTRRTLITLAALVFGLALVHLMVNLQTGQYDEMIRVGVSSLAGHVVVQREGWQQSRDGDRVLDDTAAVAEELARLFPDAVIAPRLVLGGLLVSPTASVGAGLSGVDAVAEARVQDIDAQVQQGAWLDGDGRGLVLGVELAEALGVGLGDKVVYMGQHGGATEVGSRLFRVRGVFRTGSAELDGFLAFADLPAVQEAFGRPDVSHQVTVHLLRPEESAAATARAREALAGRADLEVLSWVGALPELYAMIELDRVWGDVMLVILGIIVAFGVLNTLLMSALERTREFGVMLALGLKPRRLAGLILLEGAVLGLIGSVVGLGVGLLLSWPLVVYGIDYASMLGSDTFEMGGMAISSVMKARINPVRMGSYSVGAVGFTLLAALYPALYVARLRPVDAMRHV